MNQDRNLSKKFLSYLNLTNYRPSILNKKAKPAINVLISDKLPRKTSSVHFKEPIIESLTEDLESKRRKFSIDSASRQTQKNSQASNKRIKENDVMTAIDAFTKKSIQRIETMDRINSLTEFDDGTDVQRMSHIKSNFSLAYLTSLKHSKSGESMKNQENFQVHLYDFQENRKTFKAVQILRYRENVFRAASRLTTEMPPFPDWTYIDEELIYLDITKINVGGQVFFIFDDILSSMASSKLAQCLSNHKSEGIPFFDRDNTCFNAILNFYRTGRLHAPPNTCLTLFENELDFWGVSEHFMEPCCWSEYNTLKTANGTLKKHEEDLNNEDSYDSIDKNFMMKTRTKIYAILTTGTGGIFERWIQTISALFIVTSILLMIISTIPFVRVDVANFQYSNYKKGETITHFLTRTIVDYRLEILEIAISGYFLSELILRVILCPSRLELFSDTLNWVDLLAITTTILSNVFSKANSTGNYEGYMLLLKMPRILRLFKITSNLRSGMDAFTLTIRASTKELKLIFFLFFIMTAVFGSLIFVVEMVNESSNIQEHSKIKNINMGMWYAVETLTTLGYGDLVPQTFVGYLLGSIMIICGVILCQLPMPIVLKNFTVYNNQATARRHHKTKFTVQCKDPESMSNVDVCKKGLAERHTKHKLFTKMFNKLM